MEIPKIMKIQFDKIEYGTTFLDPVTGFKYIKISEYQAEVYDNEVYNNYNRIGMSPIDIFNGNEIIIV